MNDKKNRIQKVIGTVLEIWYIRIKFKYVSQYNVLWYITTEYNKTAAINEPQLQGQFLFRYCKTDKHVLK